MPPVTKSTAPTVAFEFILNRAGVLENVGPEPEVFAQHFSKWYECDAFICLFITRYVNKRTHCSTSEGSDVARFFNLGRDAFLISPCPSERASSEHWQVNACAYEIMSKVSTFDPDSYVVRFAH